MSLKRIYEYRSLIWLIAFSDYKLRYKGSILGFFWSLVEPLLMLLVLYVVFSNLMKMMIPYYQLYLLFGIITWNFFDRATNMSMQSIIGRPGLIQKVYFPREVLPLASTITALLMFFSEFVIFLIFLAYFRVSPSVDALFLFPVLAMLFILTYAVSLIVSSLNVYMRDIQFIWRVILQAGFFATPILYPIELIPERFRWIFLLNPVARIIISLRNSVIYHISPQSGDLLYITLSSFLLLAVGYLVFKRLEPGFAEEL